MKNKTELIAVIVAAIGVSLLQMYALKQFLVTTELIGNLVVFVSIAFGFFATSLAIFATSKYSGDLYDVEDLKNGGTILHALIKKYKIGLFLGLVSILYLLALEVYIGDSKIYFSDPFAAPLIAVLLANMFYAYRLVEIVGQFVLQEAKRA